MKVEYAILGGGIAGLSAALSLAEKGATPLLIEAGDYPFHKVCGEFISPETLPLLHKWNIFPELIDRVRFRTPTQEMLFTFPSPAGSLSHLQLDPSLAREARRLGVDLLTNTRVERWQTLASQEHELLLSDGQAIQAKHLLLATGRFPLLQSKPFIQNARYLGFKAHFRGLTLTSTLEMFSSPGLYFGIVPVEDGLYNLAGLVQLSVAQKTASLDDLLVSIRRNHPTLDAYMSEAIPQFREWMQVRIPRFGLKDITPLPRTYYIGDAVLTVPPASGNGLSLAIQCGCSAAHYAMQDDPVGFHRFWKNHVKRQLFFDQILHHMLLHPRCGNILLQAAKRFPLLAQKFYHLMRS